MEQLIKLARKGDEEALFQLIHLYKAQLYRIAYSYLKNEEEALEAIQETSCRAYQKLGQLREPAFFKTWLIRILINYCIDEQRRKGRLRPLEAGEAGSEPPAPVEERLDMRQTLERLDPKQQQVIRLKYFEDLTIREIAAVAGWPEGTVKTHLHRGLEALRNLLGREGEQDE